MFYKTRHRKLKIWTTRTQLKTGLSSDALDGLAVPVPLEMWLLIRSFYFNKARFLWYENLTKYSISVMVPYNELQSTILTGHDSAIPPTVIYVKASGYLFYIWASSFIRDPTIRFQLTHWYIKSYVSVFPISKMLCNVVSEILNFAVA